jgi:hypothetical protein
MNVFDIQLNEISYQPGSQIEGTLKILKGGGLALKDVEFKVEGKELTTIAKNENYTDPKSNTTQTRSVTYREENKFFYLDLSSFIFNAKDTGNQIYEIPFNFVLPEMVMSSYHGTNVIISYEVTALWHNRWSGDEKQITSFSVVPPLNVSNSGKINAVGSNNKGVQIILNLEKQSYRRGDSITGICKISYPNHKVRSVSFLLIGTEKAFAQGQSESITKEYKQPINLDKDKDIDINFMIPLEIPFSYAGKLSENSYVVDLKADIAFSSDVHAKEDIFTF